MYNLGVVIGAIKKKFESHEFFVVYVQQYFENWSDKAGHTFTMPGWTWSFCIYSPVVVEH